MCKVNIELTFFKLACNWILYSVGLACPDMTKIAQFVMQKMSKIPHNFFCQKCRISRYFSWRILAKILHSRKLYEIFHVWIKINSYFFNFRKMFLILGHVIGRVKFLFSYKKYKALKDHWYIIYTSHFLLEKCIFRSFSYRTFVPKILGPPLWVKKKVFRL